LKRRYQEICKDHSPQVIFDVGANKGQSIDFFSGLFPDAEIHSFEPAPTSFRVLEQRQFTSTVHLNKVGLSGKEGRLTFYECVLDETSTLDLPDLDSSYLKKKAKILRCSPDELFSEITVEITTLDAYVAEAKVSRVDILKIDVEGHEIEVLKGATNSLDAGLISIIQFEVHENDMRNKAYFRISELLKSHGYFEECKIKHSFGSFYELIYISKHQ
jgi:FkbM family methyltransferase